MSPRWLLWRYEERDGKLTKVPYQANRRKASTADQSTWTSFEEAKVAYLSGGFDGIGFVLGDEFVGVDLDHSIDAGVIKEEARMNLDLLQSYSEVSPSGTGLHTICLGEFPETGRRKGDVEVYAEGRFFTVTGDRLEEYPADVQDRTEQLSQLYNRYFKEPDHSEKPSNVADERVIELASKAANGDKFQRLMDGNTAGYSSHSEADAALCCIIAYYTKDPEQIDRIWARSGLSKREKFRQRDGYRLKTIESALKTVTGNKAAQKEIIERIPVWIQEHRFRTVADTGTIYRYTHGVYLADGEIFLSKLIESEFGDVTSDKMVKDVIGKIRRRTYTDRTEFNKEHVLNVRNGLIDLDTLQLREHSPLCLSTAQLDVLYDPNAQAPRVRKFLNEVARKEDIPLIEEILGWLLWPDYSVHKAVMLLGPGRNGKGTLLRLITAFLGKENVSNVTLQELVADRFAKSDLYGKLANIGGDLPSKDLSDTAAFRNLTGGDDNRAQEKYKAAFNFRNKAKLMFSANVLPRSQDDTYAFYSRWILIEFLNIFDVQKGTGDPDLEAKLTTPEEMSGLLNIALAGLARLRANGWRFSYDKTVEDVEMMYKRNANPVFAFLMDECEADTASYIEKQVFFNRFTEYARKRSLRPLTMSKFTELLKDQTEIPISSFRPWITYGDRPHCWLGARFKEEQSRQSILLPTPCLSLEKAEVLDYRGREGIEMPGLTGLNPPPKASYLVKEGE